MYHRIGDATTQNYPEIARLLCVICTLLVITMKLYAGTSGYSYKEWKGSFYPDKIAPAEMLSYYAERLPAVELNNTFYRTPRPNMIESWLSQVPGNFRFTVKASQGITHFRKLKDAGAATKLMLDNLSAFDDRLGAVLFRLPEDMKKDLNRLEHSTFVTRVGLTMTSPSCCEATNAYCAFQTLMSYPNPASRRLRTGATCVCDSCDIQRKS